MHARAPLLLAIVAGGIGLGAVLGAAADPEPKRAPDPPWRGALHQPVAPDSGYAFAGYAPPEDLSPYRDSYAPSWADEELTEWEPAYPEWSYSDPPADHQPGAAEADEPAPPESPPTDSPAPEPRVAGSLGALY